MLALSCGRSVVFFLAFSYYVVKIWIINTDRMMLKFVFVLQVKSGTLFDNVLICDDPEYAKQLVEETWAKQKDVCLTFYISIISFNN